MNNDVNIKYWKNYEKIKENITYEKIKGSNTILIQKMFCVCSNLLRLKETIITELAYWNPKLNNK